MMQDLIKGSIQLKQESKAYWCVFDVAAKEKELAQLQTQSEQGDFWLESEPAQRVMKKIAHLRGVVEDWNKLTQRVAYLLELAQLEDESLRTEISGELEDVERDLERREFDVLLAGKYDPNNALLAIHAGRAVWMPRIGLRCWKGCICAGGDTVLYHRHPRLERRGRSRD